MTEARWRKLSGLLDELLELAPAARALRLAEVERDDVPLAAELRRMLDVDERSGLLDGGLARIEPTLLAGLAGGDADAETSVIAGKRLGHYRLIERIGAGGMGEVWRGERVDDFEQQVAVKLIRPLLDSPQLRERFARERRILARLDHPNIARLLDGGVADDGTPWYAMEYVRGLDLVRHAAERGLGARARVELLLQVCDAVAHAHAHLIVHRDLKPSNILVDAQGRVRVLDFGIARLLDDSLDANLTGTGVRVFSPAYAAPEQIRGTAVGTAADVFALGAVLYELLTGETPHPQRAGAQERLLAELAQETAPRPSQVLRARSRTTGRDAAATRELERLLAGDLDTIVCTALQPEPARRYAGAAQLAEDLRRWLDGRPIAARPDTAGYRMRKFVARHRIAVGSASTVLLALVAGFGVALWQADEARRHAARADAEAARASLEAQRAEAQAERVRAQAERTRKVKEFLVSVFAQADPMRRASDSPATVAEAFDAALERARTGLADDPVLQADVFDDFGEILANQGRFDEAQSLFEQAIAVAEKEYGPEHPVVAESLINLGVVHGLRRDPIQGAPYLERAVAILEKDGSDPAGLINALGGLLVVRQEQGRMDEMRALSHRALTLARQHLPPDAMELSVQITNAAMLDANAGDLDAAEAGLVEAMGIVEKRQGPDSVNLWPNLTAYADVLYSRGRFDEEAAAHERALAIARKTFATDHPWTADSLVELGRIRADHGKPAEGEAMMREAIAIYDRLGSPGVLPTLRRLGVLLHKEGRKDEALATFDRAWAICRESGTVAEQHCIVLRANRAQTMAQAGRAAEALAEADAALATLAPRPALASEKAQALQARAAALKGLGRLDEARAALDEAVDLAQAAFGPDHSETRRFRAARARL